MNDGRIFSDANLLRTCLRCGHLECVCCVNWCDQCYDDENASHNAECAEATECVYDRPRDAGIVEFMKLARSKFPGGMTIGLQDGRLWALAFERSK